MSKKINFISLLSVYSSFSVVMLHINGIIWEHPIGKTWVSAIFIETFFYTAVPLFFMITGTTLIDYIKKYSTKVFFMRRIKKTLIPFLFWSVVGFIYLSVKYSNFNSSPSQFISDFLNTRWVVIYWFFISLFSTYMCIPILTRIEDKMIVFRYMIFLFVVFFSFLPFLCNLLNIDYNFELIPKFVYGYVIYSVLGYYLSHKIFTKKEKSFVYLIGVISFFTNFIGTACLTEPGGEIVSLFRGAFNWPCFFQTLATYELFKNIKTENKIILKMIDWFSSKTFGIYLIHIYLIWEIPSFLGINTYSIIWRTVGGIFIFLLSSLIVSILQKIPLIKKTIL